jgi:hypothetical protein
MPDRQPPKAIPRATSFRARYDDLEQRREQLLARLAMLTERATPHPAMKRARTLLNTTFRRSSLVQRAAVLQAADWLISMLDRASTLL